MLLEDAGRSSSSADRLISKENPFAFTFNFHFQLHICFELHFHFQLHSRFSAGAVHLFERVGKGCQPTRVHLIQNDLSA